jgi:hypothetical protein
MTDAKREMSKRGTSVSFHFCGLNLELQSADRKTAEGIRQDFACFRAAPFIPEVSIEVFPEKPPFGSLPSLPASIYTLDYVTYQGKEDIFTDYHGRGLRIFNVRKKEYQIFSESADLRYEISYLTVLSAVGQLRLGILRVLTSAQKGV